MLIHLIAIAFFLLVDASPLRHRDNTQQQLTPQQQLLQNGQAAQALNALFATLTPESTCTISGSHACVEQEVGTCTNGKYVLTKCSISDFICGAAPLFKGVGTSVVCSTLPDFLAAIAASGATGGFTGADNGTSSSVAPPVKASMTITASGATSAAATGSLSFPTDASTTLCSTSSSLAVGSTQSTLSNPTRSPTAAAASSAASVSSTSVELPSSLSLDSADASSTTAASTSSSLATTVSSSATTSSVFMRSTPAAAVISSPSTSSSTTTQLPTPSTAASSIPPQSPESTSDTSTVTGRVFSSTTTSSDAGVTSTTAEGTANAYGTTVGGVAVVFNTVATTVTVFTGAAMPTSVASTTTTGVPSVVVSPSLSSPASLAIGSTTALPSPPTSTSVPGVPVGPPACYSNSPLSGRSLLPRIAQDLPSIVKPWQDACQVSGGDIVTNQPCVNLSGGAGLNALLAGADPCDQQDVADEMIDFAYSPNITNKDSLITVAQTYRANPRNAVNSNGIVPSTPYCERAPRHVELNGLFNAQLNGTDPGVFGGPQFPEIVFGANGTCPFGTSPNVDTCKCD